MYQKQRREIGQRLKKFAEDNFDSLAEFGREFGKERMFFTPYFNGSSLPGGKILNKLAELGCDLNWLLTGEIKTERIDELKRENEELKEKNYKLTLEVSQLFKVAEAVEGYSKLKNKK